MKHSAFANIKAFILSSFCIFIGLLLIFAPSAALSGARSGLTLCAEIVIPSLFPFLCLTSFVIKCGLADKFSGLFEKATQILFKMPGCAAAALCLGIIGGYPAGAAAVSELCKKGSLKKNDGNRLLCFCINSGPAFIIGAVGAGLLKNAFAGLMLYIAHISASLLIGIFSRFFASKTKENSNVSQKHNSQFSVSKSFVYAVTESSKVMLYISAYVVLFAAVIGLFNSTGLIPAVAGFLKSAVPWANYGADFYSRILTGFFEVSNGCAAAAAGKGMAAVLLISAALSWSGLSVQCQVMSVVGESGLSVKFYIVTRIIHILFSLLFTWLLFTAFPSAIPVIASAVQPIAASIHSAPACVALLMTIAMLLLSQLKI